MDWCRLGEASAPYDELLASTGDRWALPAAGDGAGDWAEKDEGVSLLRGGDTECEWEWECVWEWEGVGGEW